MKSLPAILGLALLSVACASGTRAQSPGDPMSGQDNALMVPPGYGTLRQDDISINMRLDQIEIRFLPLDERVLRLLANDAYQALTALVRQNQSGIDSIAARRGLSAPGLALVTYLGRVPNARFDSQILSLQNRGMTLLPLGVVPLDPRFSSQELGIRGQARAIYVFDQIVPVIEPFTLVYGTDQANDWEGRLQTLDRERARVVLRAQAVAGDSVNR
ncbi:MAG: hypothetical protein ACREMH_00695 [Gemmatimonadales bacterium]